MPAFCFEYRNVLIDPHPPTWRGLEVFWVFWQQKKQQILLENTVDGEVVGSRGSGRENNGVCISGGERSQTACLYHSSGSLRVDIYIFLLDVKNRRAPHIWQFQTCSCELMGNVLGSSSIYCLYFMILPLNSQYFGIVPRVVFFELIHQPNSTASIQITSIIFIYFFHVGSTYLIK